MEDTLVDLGPDDQLIAAFVDGRATQFDEMFDWALDVIEAALGARRIARPGQRRRTSNGDLPLPDHEVALTSVALFIRMLTVGRKPPKTPIRSGDGWTLEELHITIVAQTADNLPDEHRELARRMIEEKFKRPWEKGQVIPSLSNLIADRLERIIPLLDRVWDVKRSALQARKVPGVRPAGIAIDLGPDHRIALRAAGLLVDLLTTGRPPACPRMPSVESVEEIGERMSRVFAKHCSDLSGRGEQTPRRALTYEEFRRLLDSNTTGFFWELKRLRN